MKRQEGFIDVKGGKVWYEIVGDSKNIPLLVVHGGPGYPHDYLKPLEELTNDRKVIFYDQLGCGNSEKPTDSSLWTLERFVDELKTVLNTLQLEQYHMLGQSWGAGLAAAFALTNTPGLKSIILSNPYLSTPQWLEDSKRLLKQLPKEMQEALKKADVESEDYKKALKEFYRRFFYGFDEFPTGLLKAEYKFNLDLYVTMWGPNELTSSGTLKNFDLTPRLSKINVSVLLLCGKFDQATAKSMRYYQTLLPNAQMKIFERSAHFPMWSEKEKYIKTVGDFLKSLD